MLRTNPKWKNSKGQTQDLETRFFDLRNDLEIIIANNKSNSDSSISTLNGRIIEVDSKADGISTNLQTLQSTVTSNKNEFNSYKTTVADDLTTIRDAISKQNTSIQGITTKLTSIPRYGDLIESSSVKKVTLKDSGDESIFPTTKTSFVYDSNNKTLDERLSDINTELSGKATTGGIADFSGLSNELRMLLINLIRPVRSYIITDDQNFNPNTYYPGTTWEQLDGGYALTTTKADPTTGYEMLLTRADNHIPGTNIQGGLPNITGTTPMTNSLWNYTDVSDYNKEYSGALYSLGSSNGPGPTGSGKCQSRVAFDASRSSDCYGTYQSGRANSVIADHHAVIVWRRTA